MKKNFEAPELMVQTFSVEDIIATSGDGIDGGSGDGEYGGTGGAGNED